MKTHTPFAVIVGVLALMGLSHAEETATPKPPKKEKFIAPEILVKYDKDKDGKLSREEKVEMKKDQAPKVPKEPKKEKFIAPEILAKYDKDKDGKLSKEEKVEMKKDKAPEVPKVPEVVKP